MPLRFESAVGTCTAKACYLPDALVNQVLRCLRLNCTYACVSPLCVCPFPPLIQRDFCPETWGVTISAMPVSTCNTRGV